MADISSGVELSQRLDERYAAQRERVAVARQAREEGDSQQVSAVRQADQADQARQARVAREARQLDAEQRLRDQQLVADLRRAEEERQDAIDEARQAGEGAPRGSIYDLVV